MKTDNYLQINNGKVILNTFNFRLNRFTQKMIGQLTSTEGKLNYFKHEKEKDRFQKTDAWGINYELFQQITGTINIKTEKGIYRIDKKKAQLWHKVFHFKNKNIELRCFIPVSKFDFEEK